MSSLSPFISAKFLLFSLLLGFAVQFQIISAVCGEDLVPCGNFGYPFSYSKDVTHGDCGYPGLRLNCSSNNRATILIGSNSFYVVETFVEGQLLRAVGKEVDEEDCPRPAHNFTLPTTSPFSLSPHNHGSITYFYNCSNGYPKNITQGLPCLDAYYTSNNTTARSFAFSSYDDSFNWYTRNCQETVKVPVDLITNTSDLTKSLKMGFLLQWTTPDACKACEESGGQCLYHETAACSCPPQRPGDYQRSLFDKV